MNIHLYTNVIKKVFFSYIIPNTKSRYNNEVLTAENRAINQRSRGRRDDVTR